MKTNTEKKVGKKKELANKKLAYFIAYSELTQGSTVKEAIETAKETFDTTVNINPKITKAQAKEKMLQHLTVIKTLHATGLIKGSLASWNSIASIEDNASGKSAMQLDKLKNEINRRESELNTMQLKYDRLSLSAVSYDDVMIFLEYIASQFFSIINNFKFSLSESEQKNIDKNISAMIETIKNFEPQQIVSDQKHGKERAQNKKL